MFEKFRRKINQLIDYSGLEYVGKFKDGTKIYTYKSDDLHNVNYRYYENVQEILNAMLLFKLGQAEANVFFKTILETTADAIDAPDIRTKNDAFINIRKRVEAIKIAQEQGLTLTNKEFEIMYCTFFVIDGEQPFGYSKVYNDKKIELLKAHPEMKDFFLSTLMRNLKVYQSSLERNIQTALMVMQGKQKALMSLITQQN